jgi:DNA-binding response OmpR family regulator
MQQFAGKVLIVDDDRDIVELVELVLTEAGFAVSVLDDLALEALKLTVEDLEPDCILLDGGDQHGYGSSWSHAAWLHGRVPPIPVIMFTARTDSVREAERRQSQRSRDAAFSALLLKPFELDALVEQVARAVNGSAPCERPEETEGTLAPYPGPDTVTGGRVRPAKGRRRGHEPPVRR